MVLRATVAFAGAGNLLLDIQAEETSGPAARDHVVFMGLDVLVENGGLKDPVVNADRSSIEVLRQGQRLRVPLGSQPNFKVTAEPKVSRLSIELMDVAGARVYSSGMDPSRDAMAQQMTMDSIQAHNQQLSEQALNDAIARSEGIARAERLQQGPSEADKMAAEQGLNDAMGGLSDAYGSALGGGFQPATEYMKSGSEVPFDAYEVTCRVSSPVPVEHAYALLRLTVKDARGTSIALKFFPLPHLDAKPRKLVMLQTGLPPGFTIERFNVHIYADGREIATNVSSNRVEVNEEEAFQFVLLRHVSTHRNDSVPMQAVPQLMAQAVLQGLSTAQLSRTFDVKVDADGVVQSLVWNNVTNDAVEPALDAAVRAARFLPALQKGAPVASRGTFALSELVAL